MLLPLLLAACSPASPVDIGAGLSGPVGLRATVLGTAPRTMLSGLSQPVGVLTTGEALYVGDWGTGTIYRIAA